MTLTMADSITPADLPVGYDSYLGYVDGNWPTAPVLRGRFPGKPVASLTVLGGDHVADGCDIENGDLSPASGAAWIRRRVAAGAWRPIAYASASVMPAVLTELAKLNVVRASVRLLSAHYGAGPHICGPGPGACGLVHIPMDGTQWTDTAPGNSGSRIDASLLQNDFFGAHTPAHPPAHPTTWQETMMQALPELHQGASGAHVRTVQGLLVARGYAVTVDGGFGPATAAALKRFQGNAHLTADGIAGPATWPALMGV